MDVEPPLKTKPASDIEGPLRPLVLVPPSALLIPRAEPMPNVDTDAAAPVSPGVLDAADVAPTTKQDLLAMAAAAAAADAAPEALLPPL